MLFWIAILGGAYALLQLNARRNSRIRNGGSLRHYKKSYYYKKKRELDEDIHQNRR
ncbi:MAG: hypothetical protein R2793_06620 [Flavobacteriaceae bacterium]